MSKIRTRGQQSFNIPNNEEGQEFFRLFRKFLNRRRYGYRRHGRGPRGPGQKYDISPDDPNRQWTALYLKPKPVPAAPQASAPPKNSAWTPESLQTFHEALTREPKPVLPAIDDLFPSPDLESKSKSFAVTFGAPSSNPCYEITTEGAIQAQPWGPPAETLTMLVDPNYSTPYPGCEVALTEEGVTPCEFAQGLPVFGVVQGEPYQDDGETFVKVQVHGPAHPQPAVDPEPPAGDDEIELTEKEIVFLWYLVEKRAEEIAAEGTSDDLEMAADLLDKLA